MRDEDMNWSLAYLDGWREAFPKAGKPHKETERGGILLPYKWVNERTHERRQDLPDCLKDANALLGLLERNSWEASFMHHQASKPRIYTVTSGVHRATAPTFFRAACIALLNAHNIDTSK